MIVENPHRDKPGELWSVLNQQDDNYLENEELDKTAFDTLRKQVAKGGGMVVK